MASTESVNLVTLDNLDEVWPRWDPADSNHLYALVDMGSNGIRFSISDLSPPQTRLLKCLYQERAAISLFDALSESSAGGPPLFPDKTIALVAETLARFHAIAVNDYGVPPDHVTVFATEAMRKAGNAAVMLQTIEAEVPGLAIKILHPQVETLFGSLGARSAFSRPKGLFLDLGGGSVQMSYLDTTGQDADYHIHAAQVGRSLPFGAARLIKILEHDDADFKTNEVSKLNQGMKLAFARLCETFPALADEAKGTQGIDIYLCGGGFRGYGSMLMHNDAISPYPIPAIGSYKVTGEFFAKTSHMLEVNTNFKKKIVGMSKRRRAQFPAIVTVVEALISAVPRIRSVTFCAGGNREGALMIRLPQEIRESDPLDCLQAEASLQSIVDILSSALPADYGSPKTVFGLGLGRLFVSKIWSDIGVDTLDHASAALHSAITEHPDCPGLSHAARAVMALTLCARWGGSVTPADEQLLNNLRALADTVNPDAVFWAGYIGAVATILAKLAPTVQDAHQLGDKVQFRSTVEQSDDNKGFQVRLNLQVVETALRGIDTRDLISHFEQVGSQREQDSSKKVIVDISTLP
ncbi:Ppx/GppA phosphatase family-domain-containing protein [Neurospora hispaniola]|uniref:Ppx/GppA phosphatase family-domain-containing protein n=1 Tax=Neurospora hispaniola TaxID=588809 RepID=A0AAJ0MUX3_9PEZI|nr:Ppx/GppA phosphatase family-domain-containing protein [Neurospora hispaniola]